MRLPWLVMFALAQLAIYYGVLETTPRPLELPADTCVNGALSSSVEGVKYRLAQFQQPIALSALREATRNKWIHLSGDSLVRGVYYDLVSLLNRRAPTETGSGESLTPAEQTTRLLKRHASLVSRVGSTRVTYSWAPYLPDIEKDVAKQLKAAQPPDAIVMGSGLWSLLHDPSYMGWIEDETAVPHNVSHFVERTLRLAEDPTRRSTLFVWNGVSTILDEELAEHHQAAEQFRDENARILNTRLNKYFSANAQLLPKVLDARGLSYNRSAQWKDDGLHSGVGSSRVAQSLGSFLFCHWNHIKPLTPGQVALVLLTVLTAVLCAAAEVSLRMSARTYSRLPTDEEVAIPMASKRDEPRSPAGASPPALPAAPTGVFSFYTRTIRSCLLGMLLLMVILLFVYCVDGDNRVLWQWIDDKHYSRDIFLFICLVIAVFGGYSLTPTQKNTTVVLNREQTDEWKGFMQVGFVLYHYFHAEEFYNSIRVFIGAYVWMTGYGNFLYFQRGDFSLNRLAKMLFRLNFLVCFVCVALARPFMQYYVCALHTFYFLLVYVVCYVAHPYNKITAVVYSKFTLAFAVMYLFYDAPSLGLLDLVWGKVGFMYLNNSLHEWKFRSGLDHYASIFGMMFAFHLPQFNALLQRIEAKTGQSRHLAQGSLIGGCLIVMALWARTWLFEPKLAYNALHPYTSIIPITTYVVLRNSTPLLRGKVMSMFAWCGKITLETYIFQFHIWLTDDAATIISWLPHAYPILNFVVASIIYVAISQVAFKITNIVSEVYLPADGDAWGVLQRVSAAVAIWYSALNLVSLVVF